MSLLKRISRTAKVLFLSATMVFGSALVAPAIAQAAVCTESGSLSTPTVNYSTMTVSVWAQYSLSIGCPYGKVYYVQLKKRECCGYTPTIRSSGTVAVNPGQTSRTTLVYKCTSSGSQRWFARSDLFPYTTADRTFNCS